MAVDLREMECDVLIAGGGAAGVPAALAAARHGARVVLVQDRAVLGGNASSEVRMHIVGADQHGARGRAGGALATETREGGIIEEVRLELALRNPQRSASMMDLVLYELCRGEKNLTVLLNTTLVGVEMAGAGRGRIVAGLAERPSTEDRFRIAAKVFIDCTGDGRLGLEAGAAYRHGREAQAEFDEKYAPEVADHKTLGSTILFTARKMDRAVDFVAPEWVRKFKPEDFRFRGYKGSGPNMGFEYGYWWAEWGGELDTIKDNEVIRDECLAITLGIWNYFKNGPDKGLAAPWALDWVGFLPGKRESRRFVGQHVLRESDVVGSRAFADAIAYGGWPIDIHPPEGVDRMDLPPYVAYEVPWIFDVPLRSCVSTTVENLMFAGRNISATHVAFASTRVMATCAAVGQGVGTAAAYAVAKGIAPRALTGDGEAVRAVQQLLLRDDCYLIGRANEDAGDWARRARVRTSSEQAGGEAVNVLSGQTRAVHGKAGAPPERARAEGRTHRWMSAPGLPAWLELRWDAPVTARELQLVFDTGMHRELTLSQSDGCMTPQVWGRGQPETVRDYTVAACVDGMWKQLLAVRGNYQRLRRHALDAGGLVSGVRVTVEATNGLDHARIFEVRVY